MLPGGVSLAWNTLAPTLGIAAAPITPILGATTSFAVLMTLAPALAALTGFWWLRGHVRHQLPAAAGGLLVGFDPFMGGHLVVEALRDRWCWVLAAVGITAGAASPLLVSQLFSPAVPTGRFRAVPGDYVLGSSRLLIGTAGRVSSLGVAEDGVYPHRRRTRRAVHPRVEAVVVALNVDEAPRLLELAALLTGRPA